jgi:RNA-binding protein 39
MFEMMSLKSVTITEVRLLYKNTAITKLNHELTRNLPGSVHVYVDKMSAQGVVYVKCPSVTVAFKSVQALHGRWFAGINLSTIHVWASREGVKGVGACVGGQVSKFCVGLL